MHVLINGVRVTPNQVHQASANGRNFLIKVINGERCIHCKSKIIPISSRSVPSGIHCDKCCIRGDKPISGNGKRKQVKAGGGSTRQSMAKKSFAYTPQQCESPPRRVTKISACEKMKGVRASVTSLNLDHLGKGTQAGDISEILTLTHTIR
jgi:hypothetical protein